jgi:hypothetical protein
VPRKGGSFAVASQQYSTVPYCTVPYRIGNDNATPSITSLQPVAQTLENALSLECRSVYAGAENSLFGGAGGINYDE